MRDHKWQHLVAQIPDDQPQAFASLLGQLVSYGVQRSSLLLHDPTLKPNTIPWLAAFELTWIISLLHDIDIFLKTPPFYIVTT